MAGERYETFNGRFITLGFGFEGIATATQRTAVLSRLLSWLDNGGISQAATAFPATSIRDNFNRANGGVGSNWAGATSAFAIQNNTLHTTMSSGSTDTLLWGNSFGPNQEVYTTITARSYLLPIAKHFSQAMVTKSRVGRLKHANLG